MHGTVGGRGCPGQRALDRPPWQAEGDPCQGAEAGRPAAPGRRRSPTSAGQEVHRGMRAHAMYFLAEFANMKGYLAAAWSAFVIATGAKAFDMWVNRETGSASRSRSPPSPGDPSARVRVMVCGNSLPGCIYWIADLMQRDFPALVKQRKVEVIAQPG